MSRVFSEFINSFIHEFDSEAYLNVNLDVKASGIEAMRHFIAHGLLERRRLSIDVSFSEWVLQNLRKKNEFSLHFPWVELCDRYPWGQSQIVASTLLENLNYESIYEKFPGLGDCPRNVIEALLAIGEPGEVILENLDIPNLRERSDVSETSILILNWNKPYVTLAAIASLAKWVDTKKVEIVIIDNGSDGESFSKLVIGARNFRILSLKENHFFGGGNNYGASKCQSEYLIFMNNDVLVESNISDSLISVLKSSQHIGTVGPLFVYPNRKVQEAGAFVNEDGSVEMIGRNVPLPEGWLGQDQFVDYTSAACIAIRRDDFEKVGGFDYMFEPAYYEDVDLCLRLRAVLGKRAVFTPKATVIHLEHQTSTDSALGIDFSKIIDLNKIKFQSRWDLRNPSVNGCFEMNDGEVPFALQMDADSPNPRTELHIYSPFRLTMGGGERYLLTLASQLSYEYHVSLVFDREYTTGRVNQVCRNLNIPKFEFSVCNLDESRRKQPRTLIILDNAISPSIYPHGEKNILICQFPFPRLGDSLRDTFNNLEAIDAMVAYSEFVSKWIQVRLPERANPLIRIISPAIPAYTNDLQIKDSTKILTIGRFFKGGHDKNLDFLSETLRNLNSEIDNERKISLDIVGAVDLDAKGNELISKILSNKDLNVSLHPNASNAVLQTLLHDSSIYWHASGLSVDVNNDPQNCEHFGIAPLEGMSAGLVPFAVNNGGPSSYIQDGHNGFLYDTGDELLEKTRFFLSLNESQTLEMRENARETALRFSQESFASNWNTLLNEF